MRASFLLLPQWQHILILVDLFHHPIRKVPASAVQRLAAVGAQDIRAVRQSEKMPLFAIGKGDILHLLSVQHLLDEAVHDAQVLLLLDVVFAGQTGSTLEPAAEDVKGFDEFIERFKAGLAVERAAVDSL